MRLILEVTIDSAGRSRGPWTPEGWFETAAKLKLPGLLLPLPVPDGDPADLPEADRQRLRRAAADTGVGFAGFTGVLRGTASRLVGGEQTRSATLAQLRDLIRLCSDLGGRVMGCQLPDWESLRRGLQMDQAQALAAELLRASAPLAESRRVTLCVGGEPMQVAEQLVARVNHPNIRLGCDGVVVGQLAQPLRYLRLVSVRLGDDPKVLGQSLAALGYSRWLAVQLPETVPVNAAASWLKQFTAAAGLVK